MPAYIPITESQTDPGAPGTSELWKQWRDNPLAMFEGATSAPRLLSPAHPTFAAGSVVLDKVTMPSGAQGWANPNELLLGGFTAMKAGVLRFICEVRRTTGAGAVYFAVMKNGTVANETSTSSTSFVSNQFDVTFADGDHLVFRFRADNSNAGECRNLELRADQKGTYRR